MVLGYPTSTGFPRVDSWLTDPRVLGSHKYDEHQFEIYLYKLFICTCDAPKSGVR